jgi:hypothetical protein
MILSSLKFLLN